MEAHVPGRFSALLFAVAFLLGASSVHAATYRTANFVVHAADATFAKTVGDEAERFRLELAKLWGSSDMWDGDRLYDWTAPCPIRVKVGQIGAGGATTFSFHNGEVFGWNMNVQGTEERILDSVLPHEITHTILACRFRQPLPRWADEGISTLCEHESERRRQVRLLGDVMRGGNKIPLRSLLAMKEYPPDMRDVMKLYAQGYSLTDYLVQQGGRETFLKFLSDALRHGGWDQALSAHYGVNSIQSLETKWDSWVMAGSPSLNSRDASSLAVNEQRWQQNQAGQNGTEAVIRGQSPEPNSQAQAGSLTAPSPQGNSASSAGSAPSFGADDRSVASVASQTQPPKSEQRPAANMAHQAARAPRSRSELSRPVYTQRSQSGSRSGR